MHCNDRKNMQCILLFCLHGSSSEFSCMLFVSVFETLQSQPTFWTAEATNRKTPDNDQFHPGSQIQGKL